MRRNTRARFTAGIAAGALALGALLVPQAAAADTVTGTIPVRTGSLAEVLSPDGSRLYVGSFSGTDTGSVTVVDLGAGTTTTFPTGGTQIVDMALSADGTRLYTAHRGGSVRVIDTATNTVLATATPGSTAYGVAVSPDGSRLYVSDFQNARVLVLSSATLLPVAGPIQVGLNPRLITISPDGSHAYVADQGAINFLAQGKVSRIDLATGSADTVDTTGKGTWAVQYSPDGKYVYASNAGSDSITVIDTASNTPVKTITSEPSVQLGQPYRVKFTPDGTRAYVANGTTGTVAVIDTATRRPVSSVQVGTTPTPLTIAPDGLTAYVANQTSNTVSVIALDTFPGITTTALPDGTAGVAYSAAVTGSGRPSPAFALSSGTLPPGLSLDATGALTGTPTAPGTFTFTVTASSSVSGIPGTAQRTLSITVAPAVLVATDDDFTATPVPATGGSAGDVLANDTLNGSAALPSKVTLTLTGDGGIAGATLAADGTLAIPAGAAAGAHTLAYRVCVAADPQNCDTATVAVRILAAVVVPPTPSAPSAPPAGSGPNGSAPAPAAPALASTGSETALPLVGAAALLLLAGTALIAARRRRAAAD
jgi:LPXTG-motif cell wall-anchored protein